MRRQISNLIVAAVALAGLIGLSFYVPWWVSAPLALSAGYFISMLITLDNKVNDE